MLQINQRLCDEVKYILERKIKSSHIEIGSLSSRAKSLESFCEKIDRKKYQDPFKEITDLAGARIVFLYASDRQKLEKLVEDEFEIHEKVDKLSDNGVEKFGYGALHYVISLKERHAGARYDDLRGVYCEIQIRTILQDAWAVVAHHLSYKHEEDIPSELRRKLHALSGLFETADDQFERINFARTEYQNRVRDSIKSNPKTHLEVGLNLDSLLGYLTWKFPDRKPSSREATAELLEELNRFGYNTLKKVDEVVERAWDAVIASEKQYPPIMTADDDGKFLGVGIIRNSLEFLDKDYRESRIGDLATARINAFVGLLKP